MMIKHFPEESSMVEGSIKDILNFKDDINLYVLITVRIKVLVKCCVMELCDICNFIIRDFIITMLVFVNIFRKEDCFT